MRTRIAVRSRQLPIKSDYDVVAVRQEVRQAARDLGLGLSQQAKIATAISTITRALLAANVTASVYLRADDALPRPALELSCRLTINVLPESLAQLEQLLHFGAARALVDEAALALEAHGALLTLRMWLSR
jgi:hypothetical protein